MQHDLFQKPKSWAGPLKLSVKGPSLLLKKVSTIKSDTSCWLIPSTANMVNLKNTDFEGL